MEISSYYPYRAHMLPETEGQNTAPEEAVARTAVEEATEEVAADRLTLVRSQNLASPLAAEIDLPQALEVLKQVQDQLQLLNKEEMGDLYQVQRLREVLYRVTNPETL